MQSSEVDELVSITRATGFFRPEEVDMAREVLSEAAQRGESSGYAVRVASDVDGLLGYVCFGPTPGTQGTWDLYWIAVRPESQGRGIGSGLMNLAEEEIRRSSGRLIVVETSSQEMYEPTRRFYRSLGYREASRIPDFYDVGDDRLTFVKVLPGEVVAR